MKALDLLTSIIGGCPHEPTRRSLAAWREAYVHQVACALVVADTVPAAARAAVWTANLSDARVILANLLAQATEHAEPEEASPALGVSRCGVVHMALIADQRPFPPGRGGA